MTLIHIFRVCQNNILGCWLQIWLPSEVYETTNPRNCVDIYRCFYIQQAIIFECYVYFIHVSNCYIHELHSVVQHRPWYLAGTGSHIAIIQNRNLSVLHAMALLVSSCSDRPCHFSHIVLHDLGKALRAVDLLLHTSIGSMHGWAITVHRIC